MAGRISANLACFSPYPLELCVRGLATLGHELEPPALGEVRGPLGHAPPPTARTESAPTKRAPGGRTRTPCIGTARSPRRATRIAGSCGIPARRSRATPRRRGGRPPALETSRSDRALPDTRRPARAAAAHSSSTGRPRQTERIARATARGERNWGLFKGPDARRRSFCSRQGTAPRSSRNAGRHSIRKGAVIDPGRLFRGIRLFDP